MIHNAFVAALLATALAGCSGIKFSNRDDGHSHPYRVAAPALKVITDPDCKMSADVISIPAGLNYLSFRSGLGKSDATVIFEPGGTIKQISSKQDGVTDDIVKLIGAAKSIGAFGTASERAGVASKCPPSVAVYPILFDPATGRVTVDKGNPILAPTGRS